MSRVSVNRKGKAKWYDAGYNQRLIMFLKCNIAKDQKTKPIYRNDLAILGK